MFKSYRCFKSNYLIQYMYMYIIKCMMVVVCEVITSS